MPLLQRLMLWRMEDGSSRQVSFVLAPPLRPNLYDVMSCSQSNHFFRGRFGFKVEMHLVNIVNRSNANDLQETNCSMWTVGIWGFILHF